MVNNSYLIKNAFVVNEGKTITADVLVAYGRIDLIAPTISNAPRSIPEIDGTGLHLLPGCIDDQVHFREPGLTHKADIYTESRAAVAGGVTSFMEMPNTNPQTLTQELLEAKYAIGAQKSMANYSFFMGGSNDNIEELKKTSRTNVCGVKLFMGSSTGNMLVDNEEVLQRIFGEVNHLIAIHSESEEIIKRNTEIYKAKYGDNIPMSCHPEIRSVEACFKSTEKAVDLAKRLGTRLHVLHISTADEIVFFGNDLPLKDKRITAEACVHHLWFDSNNYERLGGLIKCNPAIKAPLHKKAIMRALLDDRIDIIATDHAPHTWDEKQNLYLSCPSGLPLVQHPLLMMLEFARQGVITIEKVVEKMAHAPAECFKIRERGYIREGYAADLVLVDLNAQTTVEKSNLLYKCGWSPLEGTTFHSKIIKTFINGRVAWSDGQLVEGGVGERLKFN